MLNDCCYTLVLKALQVLKEMESGKRKEQDLKSFLDKLDFYMNTSGCAPLGAPTKI